MWLRADLRASSVKLHDADDFGRFHIEVSRNNGDGRAQLDDLLHRREIGFVDKSDPNEVWVRVSAIRRLATGRVREDWEANFERMLTFAGERGWVDQGGTHVRAHVEWVTT